MGGANSTEARNGRHIVGGSPGCISSRKGTGSDNAVLCSEVLVSPIAWQAAQLEFCVFFERVFEAVLDEALCFAGKGRTPGCWKLQAGQMGRRALQAAFA